MKIKKAHIAALAFVAFSVCTKGQSLHFQSYSTSEGLSQNSIYSIAQTREGFMWFGTQDGLNRFDGKKFWLADLKDHETNTAFSKMITALLPDKNDKFWTGTTQELLIYDRYINRFYRPERIYKGFVLAGKHYITKLLEDKLGNVWILTQKDGLYAYSYIKQQMLQIKWANSIPEIVSIAMDRNGTIWACSQDHIFKWNGDVFTTVNTRQPVREINELSVIGDDPWITTKLSEVILLKQEEGFKSYPFSSFYKGSNMLSDPTLIHQSDSNTVWIGSRSEGVISVNLAEKKFTKSQSGNGYPFLRSPFCLSFFTSLQGNTWIGLSGGLAMHDKHKMNISLWRNDPVPGQPFPDNRVFSIYTSNDEDFYLGTLYMGLHQLNTRFNTSSYYMPPGFALGSAASRNIYGIIKGSRSLLWMATWAGLYSFDINNKKFHRYYEPEDKKTVQLTSILMLGNTGKILCSGYNDGLRIFNTVTGKFERCNDPQKIADTASFRVRYMKETGGGNVLMSTEGKCLISYNYLSGVFTFFPHFASISGASRYFMEDGETLWVATDDGLIQADKASMKIQKVWSTMNGLPNNYIYAILSDRNNRIWVSSNGGVSMLDRHTGIIESFTVNDGLQDMEFNTASCYKSKSGKLWFGGVNGLNMIDPGLSSKSQQPPAPLIIQVNVMNMPYASETMAPYIHAIRLPYSKNFINFEFQSPDFSQGGNTVYEYMLTGVDTGWVNSQGRNFANYTKLAPGSYVLKVRAINARNLVSEISEKLVITIIPPWYKTWWFYMLVTALLLSAVFLLVRQKIGSIKYKAGIRQQITETEIAALKAQMNPHFIFNCINSIDAFIHSNDKYNATVYLNKFAKLLRNILDSSKQNMVAFTKDIETLRLYIELEELRHEKKFTTSMAIDDELLNGDYKVPPLIVQPFVENAILHGLKNREGNGGLLQITITKQLDTIEYNIKDNGIGRKTAALIGQKKESSYGMQISFDRIRLFNKEEKASVKITDLYENGMPSGTAVSVSLKII